MTQGCRCDTAEQKRPTDCSPTRMMDSEQLSSSSTAIGSSNIGFQLLKKCGWTEGTGLGVAEQGRLEPVEAYIKNNKRGLGAEKTKSKMQKLAEDSTIGRKNHNESKKKAKALSKRARKLQEQEKRFQEKEFEMAFFREFWPDNV